jgi:hypothetical protein
MALPGITVPDGIPILLGEGHAIEESSVFAAVKPATGHGRMRRRYTVPDRQIPVNWSLDAAEMAVFEDWFHNALDVGSNYFSIRVKDQDSRGLLWWKAKWAAPFKATPLTSNRWRVTGVIILFGEGSSVAPVSSALAMSISVPLFGTAALSAPQPLALEISVALQSIAAVGSLSFSAALVQLSFAVYTAPGVGAMTLSTLAPTTTVSNGTFITPGVGSMTLTGRSLNLYKILMNFEGSNGSTTFTDTGNGSSVWTGTGGAALTTTSPISGSSSLLLTADTDYIEAPYVVGANSIPPTDDFSLKISFKSPTSNPQQTYMLSVQDSTGSAAGTVIVLYIGFGGPLALYISDGTTRSLVISGTSGLATANTVATYEVRRVGPDLYLYVNGSSVGNYSVSGFSFAQPSGLKWRIGQAEFTGPGTTIAGMWVDDFSLQ